jgi:dephospho-CoA kinase
MKKNEPRRRPWRIALTGGIGCGKTAAAQVLQALGAVVWDADESVHRQLRRGTVAYQRIVRAFGPGVVRAGGGLCRVVLAQTVFADAGRRRTLEKILHPAVIREMRGWLAEQRRGRRNAIAVVPLLFEAGLDRGWDAVVCVAAEEAVALRRLGRRGVAEDDARRRMAAQWPLARKVKRSDYIIWNNGTRRQLAAQVKKFWANCPEEN